MTSPPTSSGPYDYGRGIGRLASRIFAVAFAFGYPLAIFVVLRRFPSRHDLLVKLVPVLVNAWLLGVFAWSLRGPQSMVERFARRQDPDLSPDKVRYCRNVTLVWCGFFVLNIAVTLALAAAAPLAWWSLYTGGLAYVLVAALFVGEYLVRKRRFRDYGPRWHDRWLAARWPPKNDDD